MGSSQYSFMDIVVLDEVRTRFACGDALVILSLDLNEVLWANGPGARLLGFADIGKVIGAEPKLGLAAERQIASTPGFPDIGRDRQIAVRVANGFASRVVNLLASCIVMPDGDKAVLLAAPAGEAAGAPARAERAIGGFGEEGRYIALLDGEGKVLAASPEFGSLAIGEDNLLGLITEARGPERLAKKRIPVRGLRMPAGLARLIDEPATHLIVVVDDGEAAESAEFAAATSAPEPVSPALQDASATAKGDDSAADLNAPSDIEATIAASAGGERSHGSVDRWYFHHEEGTRSAVNTPPPHGQDNEPPAISAPPAPAPRQLEFSTAPVKFVWRTGSDGRFTSISEEFSAALGEASADVVGRSFREVADAFGFDADGEIAALLARRDTWSGRSVLWPIAGTDRRVPVDLAALPVYGRDRSFQGFRGFGVARMGDGVTAPLPAARLPGEDAPAGEQGPAGVAESELQPSETNDPFRGEVPALAIVPKPERRHSDKVIRLAEHRPAAAADEGLSQTERNAFREIGARLRKDSAKTGDAAAPQTADANVSGEADAERPIVRETFGKRDWLKTASSQAELQDNDPAVSGHQGEDASPATDAIAEAGPDAEADAAHDPVEAGTEAAVPEDGTEAAAGDASTAVSATADETDDAGEAEAANVAREEPSGERNAPGEEPAAAQPDLYQTLLSKLPTPVLVHAGDELHYANDEFLRLTGYPSLEAIRDAGGLGELFADPYEAEDDAEDRRLRLRTASGEAVPVEALLQSVPWKGGKSLMLALRPAEQERQAEIRQFPMPRAEAEQPPADVAPRLEELRAIIDTATDGVVLISPEGTIRSISRPAEALFGFDSDEVAGKPFAALFAMESQRAAQDYLQGLSDNGVASVLNDGREVIGREAQGRFIPLFMTIGRLPGDSGFCAVLRDVTQWKRAEEELTQARAQAELASSQKTEFLARVSHEIRTPLNAIIGFSELMMDEKFGSIGNDRYRDYLRDINRSGNHVLDLVNDLLDISKIEAGEQEMNYEAVSLNDTLAETVALMQPQANRERVIIRSSFPSRLPEVVADLRSVRQIALNLLSNAIRYTQAGGQVIVSTSYEASGDIVMRVRDTGVGMSQAEIEQAMKPFKQVNALKRPRGDGTGLGLPLTKAMVEANRARFAISSAPGEGTLVEVTFPSTRVLAD